jgi:eukaryotic-like serine/threonine-protein kinase
MTSWAPGSLIGSYEVLDLLGRGGMGSVYRVRHVITNRIEAIKIVSAGAAAGPEKKERFNREIRALASMAHPNIAGLHTAFYHEEQLVMVMEHVQGSDLGTRLRSGITLHESLDFSRQILRALEYAHSQGVIHRDIKPSNVMVTANQQIKLLDFGLALVELDTRLTAEGMLVGSMHYISPQLIGGEPGDALSDLYAVGVTVYEMITGRLPIHGTTYAQIVGNHLMQQPIAPEQINPGIPEPFAAAVMKALKKDKAQRWQSAADFLRALDSVHIGSAGNLSVVSLEQMPAEHMPVSPSTPTKAMDASPVPSKRSSVQPEVMSEIAARLASHIGPIAKILVKRASGSAHDVRELCELVAREIDSEEKRRKFLQSVEVHIRASQHD